MDLYFLGTGAGMPSTQRNVSSIALRLFEERGTFWMFDCGEGTQHQMLKSPLKASKLEKLFITHLHGDHIYGIPGLLTSRTNQGGETPVYIYGPPGLEKYILHALQVSHARLSYPLKFIEIEEGILFQDEQFVVETARLEHRIESFGFRITELDRPGRLQIDKLQESNVRPGPIYGQLKQGKDVTLPDGRTLYAADLVGPRLPGRKIAIMGDTRACDAVTKLSSGVDVLVHEATFSRNLADLAHQYYHTTTENAARTAKQAEVGALIMTHLSSRYKGESEAQLLLEAKEIFANSYLAQDFWAFPIIKRIP